jgi:broad specificity phosphatase PhoE
MTVINFFLTRHGETQWNKIGKFQGQLDSPLTKKGVQQAYAIAEQLRNNSIQLIVSSTLPRAKRTAEICQPIIDCTLTLNPSLIERNFGIWQGNFIDDVKATDHYQEIFHQVNCAAPLNGESGVACAIRFQQALISIASKFISNTVESKKNEQNDKKVACYNILVVSHGDILRCFLSTMVNNFSEKQAINKQNKAFDNGCIFQLSYHLENHNFTLLNVHDITQLPMVSTL